MTDATTAQLLAEAERLGESGLGIMGDAGRDAQRAVLRLTEVIRRQQAQIAALEAARAPHGPPLEGTGPLPLERKGG